MIHSGTFFQKGKRFYNKKILIFHWCYYMFTAPCLHGSECIHLLFTYFTIRIIYNFKKPHKQMICTFISLKFKYYLGKFHIQFSTRFTHSM